MNLLNYFFGPIEEQRSDLNLIYIFNHLYNIYYTLVKNWFNDKSIFLKNQTKIKEEFFVNDNSDIYIDILNETGNLIRIGIIQYFIKLLKKYKNDHLIQILKEIKIYFDGYSLDLLLINNVRDEDIMERKVKIKESLNKELEIKNEIKE